MSDMVIISNNTVSSMRISSATQKNEDAKLITKNLGSLPSYSLKKNNMASASQSYAATVHYNFALSKVDGFTDLSVGWDGFDANPPTLQAIHDAKFFIDNNIRKLGLVMPIIRAITDGEINLFWDLRDIILDVAIFGDGNFSYYSNLKKLNEENYDDLPINESLPYEYIEMLKVK
jgi:hypothetical protein